MFNLVVFSSAIAVLAFAASATQTCPEQCHIHRSHAEADCAGLDSCHVTACDISRPGRRPRRRRHRRRGNHGWGTHHPSMHIASRTVKMHPARRHATHEGFSCSEDSGTGGGSCTVSTTMTNEDYVTTCACEGADPISYSYQVSSDAGVTSRFNTCLPDAEALLAGPCTENSFTPASVPEAIANASCCGAPDVFLFNNDPPRCEQED